MNSYIDFIALFFLSVIVITDIIRNKKKIKFEKVIMFRYSDTFVKKLENFTIEKNKFFSFFSLISLIISIPTISLIVYFLISSFIQLQPSVALVLPSVAGYKYPGPIVSVPFFYWIISIFLIVLFHETMHAVIAINNKIKVKKYGIIYLLFIPIGAFVDIDEKKLKNSNLTTKIKIYSAGSLGNFLLSLISFILIYSALSLFNFLTEDKGVYFDSLIPNSPAEKVNLSGVIYQINETKIKNIYDLNNFLLNRSPGERIKIYTSSGEYELELGEMNNRSFIGINNVKTYFVYKNTNKKVEEILISSFSHFLILLRWILILSLGVGLANMLPIIPLDGGLVIKDIMIKILGERKGEKFAKIVSTIFILLIFASLILSLKFQIKVF
ncbi:MAG: M50 family metallopeptidase [Candidatus Aenigmatarchaeota archaeon]